MTSTCSHQILRQTQLGTFPPLYLSLPISANVLPRLEKAYQDLGDPEPCSPFLAQKVQLLRRNLEAGLSRERRLKVREYVRGIEDPKKRAATELYLARYKGFRIRRDGGLDFGVEEERLSVEKWEGKSKLANCVVM